MSNIKISQLPQAQILTGSEQVPVNQQGVTVRTTAQAIASLSNVDISQSIIADAGSTTKVPSVNATKTYVDGLVLGLVDDRGNFTPSPTPPGGFPTLNGSGTGGQIMKGDLWFIDDVGYIDSVAVTVGQSIRALQDNPLQDPTKWNILSAGLIQSTLDAVLAAGNTAVDKIIELTTTSAGFSHLGSDIFYIQDITGGILGVYSNTHTSIQDSTTNPLNSIYVTSSVEYGYPYITAVSVGNNTSGTLQNDSLIFTDSIGTISIVPPASITGTQILTMPDNTGIIALTSDILPTTLQQVTSGVNKDLIDSINLQGIDAGASQSGHNVNLFGESAGSGNSINNLNAFGYFAARGNSGSNVNALGFRAADNNVYSDINAFGRNAYADHNNQTVFSKDGGLQLARLSYTNLTANRKYELPDNSGTIALLSDIANTSSWSLAGNAGTIPGTDFIGTTDNVDLVFKVNNTEVLRIDSVYGQVKTTNSFRAEGADTLVMAFSNIGNGGVFIAQDNVTKGYIGMNNGSGGNSQIQCNNLTSSTVLQLPDASGTIPLSVNGNTADSAGEITLTIPTVTLQVATAGTNKNLTNGINLQGTNAGTSNSGTNINAFGTFAGNFNSGSRINAFGNTATENNTGSDVNALGNTSAYQNAGTDVNALGNTSAILNLGSHVNALGKSAASSNSGSGVNAMGQQAASSNSGTAVNAMGDQSAYVNSGSNINAFGTNAAQTNNGDNVNALGANAASGNTGSDVNAFGLGAGTGNTLSGMTIFSNDSMPSYADYTAASAAITVMLGATAGCTYLYHDQATNSIGAVRL